MRILRLFLAAVVAGSTCFTSHALAQDFDALRTKWFTFLTAPVTDNQNHPAGTAERNEVQTAAIKYWEELQGNAPHKKNLWSDLNYTYSRDITTSYKRLEIMALAYCLKGSQLYHHPLLLRDMVNAMDWLYAHQYNEHTLPPVPAEGSNIRNWWDYMIGSPLKINNITVLLYNRLTPLQVTNYMKAVDHFTNDFTDRYTRQPLVTTFSAANRVWVSTVLCIKGILVKDAGKIDFAAKGLSALFPYAVAGDGFYKDGSFIQHIKHPYTGGYGVALLSCLTEELYLLSGTPWELKNQEKQQVYNWIYQSFGPLMYKGAMMSMVQGREISRQTAQERSKGLVVIKSVRLLVSIAPVKDALRMKRMLRLWLREDPGTEQSFYKQFPAMDRAVQQNRKYAFGISMHSARIYNYESRAGYENLKAWHTGDGQTYLYNNDLLQYDNDFWPTVDPYMLPGTTIEAQTECSGWKTNTKNWVGGVNMLDKYGATGMEIEVKGQTLAGKKSWFMFDGTIVALGAGISNRDGKQVQTIIEQRKLMADNSNQFIVNGKLQQRSDTNLVYNKAHWAWLSGNVEGAAIGYFFPGQANIHIRRKMHTGSWYDINKTQEKSSRKHFYLTLWNGHGNHNSDDNAAYNKYAYVLLPGFSAKQVEKYAGSPDVTIVENTALIQAVIDHKLNLLAANFWDNKPVSVKNGDKPDYLQCDKKAAVMVWDNADRITVAVADPTMLNNEMINITVDQQTLGVISCPPNIKVNSLNPKINISVDVKDLKGATSTVSFSKNKNYKPVLKK